MKPLSLLWVFIAVAIFFIACMYLKEGFATQYDATTDEVLGNQVETCKASSESCSQCLSNPQCGWCSESSACVPRIAARNTTTSPGGEPTFAILPKWVTENADPAKRTCKPQNFVSIAGKCPNVVCASNTNCRDCAGNVLCGWCPNSKICLSKTPGGNDPAVPAGTTCDPKIFITTSSTCPAVECSTITDCATCTNNTGCGFCKDTNKCITLVDYKGVPVPNAPCPKDSIITFGTQCPGAMSSQSAEDRAKAMAIMKSLGGGSGNTDQQPNTLDGAMEMNEVRPDTGKPLVMMNEVRPDTGKPVSPATMYSQITAPGVARPVGASSIPPLVRHDPAFGDAPLESYVKLLVNSQLAKQGVPMNEPFQVRESDAIPNATDYIKKVFRGVFN